MDLRRPKSKSRKMACALHRSLILPLLALPFGCGSNSEKSISEETIPAETTPVGCPKKDDSCIRYNDTTMTINTQTDGALEGIEKMIISDGLLSRPLADAISETHALATRGLPEGHDLKITEVYLNCFEGLVGGRADASAYSVHPAIDPSCGDREDSGIYVPERELNLKHFFKISHEIGSFQHPNSGEVGPQLNALEQGLMFFSLYAEDGGRTDGTRWISYSDSVFFGLPHLQGALTHFQKGSETEPALETDAFVDQIKAAIFVFERLNEYRGNIAAIRGELDGASKSDLAPEIEKATEVFAKRYSNMDRYLASADVKIRLKTALMQELSGISGPEVAIEFFIANSHTLYPSFHFTPILLLGLDGMNCAPAGPSGSIKPGDCTDSQNCAEWGASNLTQISDLPLRCYSVSLNGDQLSFEGWDIVADAKLYNNWTFSPLTVDGSYFLSVYDFYNRSSLTRYPLELDN